MQIYYATSNPGKFQSVQRDVNNSGLDITVEQLKIENPEPRSSDVEKIALQKVSHAYSIIGKPVIAQDSGFYIFSLNGFPESFVNFALEKLKLPGILKLVNGLDRSCEFRQCLAYMDSKLKAPVSFMTKVKGSLSEQVLGEMKPSFWSELALIFIPEGYMKTHGEMSNDEFISWKKVNRKNSETRQFIDWYIKNRY